MTRDDLEEQAAYWIAKRDGGDFGAQLQQDLEAWLNHSAAHRVTFLRLDHAWRKADMLREAARASSHGAQGADKAPD